MKRLLSLCALALTAGYVQAQTSAGRMSIGGNIGYTAQNYQSPSGDTKITSFDVSPQFGYFVADNVAVGLQAGYYNQKVDYPEGFTGDFESKYHAINLSPFVRYYMFTPNEKFAFYAQARAGIGFTTVERGDAKIKGTYFVTQLSPGFSYFFNEKWMLDLQLAGISYYSSDANIDSDANNDKSSTFNIGASLTPYLGFRYFMGQ